MPDQLPSALLDINSPDSLFALQVDTKNRFSNILDGIKTPPNYDIPTNTPIQSELLNPVRTTGSIGDAMFSPDLKVAQFATDTVRNYQNTLPINKGIGEHQFFGYSKEMNKFLNGDFGYNPYQSIAENEDFNYRYDYMNSSTFGRVVRNVGTGLGRFLLSVGAKLGQTIGYTGALVGHGIATLVGGESGSDFMSNVADNSLSRWFEGKEQDMKDSNLLSVFKPANWNDMGFFEKLKNGAMWTDEIADGAAFMGEMVASMYLLGGLGKVAGLGKFGSTAINTEKFLSKYGQFTKGIGRTTDFLAKMATGADDIQGVGRWAFSVASEAAFEASDGYHRVSDNLKEERSRGLNTLSDAEIQKIAGDRAATRFKANLLILSASNAFENRFIFGPLFNKELARSNSRITSRLINVSDDASSLEKLAQASRKQYNYGTWLGKKLNWKDPNSRLRFYGSRGLSATAAEGFWEENAQLAAERLSSAGVLTNSGFWNQLGKQTVDALKGNDPEASENIGLGALIGIGGTSIVSKVKGGGKLFLGERKKTEQDVQAMVDNYEEYRKKFLNFQDIYVTDQTRNADGTPSATFGNPVKDEDGNMQIDDVKAAALMNGMNQFTSQQAAIDKVADPYFKQYLQDKAMLSFVIAAKGANIFNRVLDKFSNLENLDAETLQKLGFDPNTTIDSVHLKKSVEVMGELYDKAMKSESKTEKGEEMDDMKRKFELFGNMAQLWSAKKISNLYRSDILAEGLPSVYSKEAADHDSAVEEFNSLMFRMHSTDDVVDLFEQHGKDFWGEHVKNERDHIMSESERLLGSLSDKLTTGELVFFGGFIMSRQRYKNITGHDPITHNVLYTPESFKNRKNAFQIPLDNADIEKLGLEPGTYLDINWGTPAKGETYTNYDYSQKMHNRTIGKDSRMRGAAMAWDAQNTLHAKWGQLEGQAARLQHLVDKFGHPTEGIKNFKKWMAYNESIQKADSEADMKTNARGPEEPPVPPTPPANTGEVAARPVPVAQKPSTENVSKHHEAITTVNSMLKALMSDFVDGKELQTKELGEYIVANEEQHGKAMTQAIISFLQEYSNPLLEKMKTGVLDENLRQEWDNVGAFIAELFEKEVIDGDMANKVGDFMDTVDEEIKDFVPTEPEEPEIYIPQVGDKVIVNTKKDGQSVIKEIKGDKAVLEDGRTVSLKNLIKVEETEAVTESPDMLAANQADQEKEQEIIKQELSSSPASLEEVIEESKDAIDEFISKPDEDLKNMLGQNENIKDFLTDYNSLDLQDYSVENANKILAFSTELWNSSLKSQFEALGLKSAEDIYGYISANRGEIKNILQHASNPNTLDNLMDDLTNELC